MFPLFVLALAGMYSCEGTTEETVTVTEVKLNKNSLSLKVGTTATLNATVLPDNVADKSVSWESSNTAVATVEDGLVTAITEGEANITVTTTDGGKTAVCKITVSNDIVAAIGVILNETAIVLEPEATAQLIATVKPDNATDKAVAWESSDDNIATVDQNGLVTAVAGGQATITVTTNDSDFTAECKVTVRIPVTDISINQPSVEIAPDATYQLAFTITPTTATDKSVTWSSSADNIATVDQNGLVTAVADGQATITVTTTDGGHTAECAVTVKTIQVISIAVSPSSLELEPGDTGQLSVTFNPANATDRSVTWSSSNTAIATVDQNGLVRALAAGEANIMATTTNGMLSSCRVTVVSFETWARSNVVWVADSSKPDGGYLTFAVTAADNATIKSNVGGVFFKWGSLVPVSLVGNSYNSNQIIFSPTGNKNYTWENIPSLGGETAPPFDNNVLAEDDFAGYNGTGFDEAAGRGDVCRYISAKGWVEGDWRLPTGKEFNDLMAEGRVAWSGSTWANVTVPAGNNNEYGFYEFVSGYFFGDGVAASDNKESPVKGVSIPVASYRAVWGGSQTSAGNYGSYWTGSSRLTTDAYGLDVSSMNASMVNSSRGYGFVVRCIRE